MQEQSWRKTKQSDYKCMWCRKTKNNNQVLGGANTDSDDPVSPAELRRFMLSVNNKLDNMANLDAKVSNMDKNLEEVKQSVDFISSKYDEMAEKFEKWEAGTKREGDKVKELGELVKVKNEEIANLKIRMRDTEQYARNKNIEISGVEVRPGENLYAVMKNIAEKIKVPYSESDIDVIHRLPSRRGDACPKIVAQFVNRTIRNQWLKCKGHGGFLRSSELVPGGTSDTRVYLNTHLTSEWQRLLWMAKQKGRPNGYLLVWFQDNKILAKKNVADSRAVFIFCEDDLSKLD